MIYTVSLLIQSGFHCFIPVITEFFLFTKVSIQPVPSIRPRYLSFRLQTRQSNKTVCTEVKGPSEGPRKMDVTTSRRMFLVSGPSSFPSLLIFFLRRGKIPSKDLYGVLYQWIYIINPLTSHTNYFSRVLCHGGSILKRGTSLGFSIRSFHQDRCTTNVPTTTKTVNGESQLFFLSFLILVSF